MMNRTIGSGPEPSAGISTSASGSTGTTVTPSESLVTSQPVVSTGGSQKEEVRSKVPGDIPNNDNPSGSKDDQPVPMATDPPTEGSGSSDNKVVPSTTPAPPPEEQRRPRLTIRLVHRPRGAPRCECYILYSNTSVYSNATSVCSITRIHSITSIHSSIAFHSNTSVHSITSIHSSTSFHCNNGAVVAEGEGLKG